MVAKTLVVNVNDQVRDQSIIEIILVTNLETNYNFLLKTILVPIILVYKLISKLLL